MCVCICIILVVYDVIIQLCFDLRLTYLIFNNSISIYIGIYMYIFVYTCIYCFYLAMSLFNVYF